MEKPGPTQLGGPAPSLPVPTKKLASWFNFLSPARSFLSFWTAAFPDLLNKDSVCRVCVWVQTFFLLFRLRHMHFIHLLSFHHHTHSHTHTHHMFLICFPMRVSSRDPCVKAFPPPTARVTLTPSPHPRSLWQRGLPPSNDDSARCGCDWRGNTFGVVAMDTRLNGIIRCVIITHCTERSYVWKHCSMRVSLEIWSRLSSWHK